VAGPVSNRTVIWSGSDYSSWDNAFVYLKGGSFTDRADWTSTHYLLYPVTFDRYTTRYHIAVNVTPLNATYIAIGRNNDGDAYVNRYVVFDLVNGTVARGPTGANFSASISSNGDGSYRIEYSMVRTSASVVTGFNIASAYNTNGNSSEVMQKGTGSPMYLLGTTTIWSEPV